MRTSNIRFGYVFTVSGPAGAGKTSSLDQIRLAYGNKLSYGVTCTTREARKLAPGSYGIKDGTFGVLPEGSTEQNGVHYFFYHADTFNQMKAEGKFLETDTHGGAQYGTLWETVNRFINSATEHIIFAVNNRGASEFKEKTKRKSVSLFLTPSFPGKSFKEGLAERMRARGMLEEKIEKRIEIALGEMQEAEAPGLFDFKIDNPDGNQRAALDQIFQIIFDKTGIQADPSKLQLPETVAT